MKIEHAMEKIYKKNLYEDFPISAHSLDIDGWGSENPIFREYIEKIKPESVIEVGSWKGASAIHMAGICKTLNLNTKIICIDTWLGSIEHLINPEITVNTSFEFGSLNIYHKFIANIILTNNDDMITPFRQTSLNAARYLKSTNTKVDLIYIDASHEEDDVYSDIVNYWELLRDGGAMIGDDCINIFPGVVNSVRRFMKERNLVPKQQEEKWVFEKPMP